jgi:predicted dehydrogenase
VAQRASFSRSAGAAHAAPQPARLASETRAGLLPWRGSVPDRRTAMHVERDPSSVSRRTFLERSAALAAGAAVARLPAVHPGGSDALRVGLIGCGGRGTGAAAQALAADPNTQLVALADVFADHLESSLGNLMKTPDAARVDVPPERRFVGFDAYRELIASGVDVVILATSPHFRPAHLKAAVEAGKHTFVEKPVAVDGPGVRSILETCELAKRKKLSVVSGLCYRYHDAMRETIARVHDGQIGDIVAMECSYLTGALWHHARQPGWSDMEWQMRNWLYFTWLSGDHIAEQHIHSLDKLAWAMGDRFPVRATGTGGRQVRTDPAFGNVYDHFAITYEFENGVKAFGRCRQQPGCVNDVNDYVMGTKGTCDVMRQTITGEKPWAFKGKRGDMYQNEHDALFASIRKGEPINNGEYMAHSTLMAIMGRMAAYTGKAITWEQALNSQEKLGPETYEWGEIAVEEVAMPGITKFS